MIKDKNWIQRCWLESWGRPIGIAYEINMVTGGTSIEWYFKYEALIQIHAHSRITESSIALIHVSRCTIHLLLKFQYHHTKQMDLPSAITIASRLYYATKFTSLQPLSSYYGSQSAFAKFSILGLK